MYVHVWTKQFMLRFHKSDRHDQMSYRQIGKHESLEGKTNYLSTLNIFVELVVK